MLAHHMRLTIVIEHFTHMTSLNLQNIYCLMLWRQLAVSWNLCWPHLSILLGHTTSRAVTYSIAGLYGVLPCSWPRSALWVQESCISMSKRYSVLQRFYLFTWKKNFDSREYICCAATVPCRDKPQTDTVKDSSIGNDLSKPLELL